MHSVGARMAHTGNFQKRYMDSIPIIRSRATQEFNSIVLNLLSTQVDLLKPVAVQRLSMPQDLGQATAIRMFDSVGYEQNQQGEPYLRRDIKSFNFDFLVITSESGRSIYFIDGLKRAHRLDFVQTDPELAPYTKRILMSIETLFRKLADDGVIDTQNNAANTLDYQSVLTPLGVDTTVLDYLYQMPLGRHLIDQAGDSLLFFSMNWMVHLTEIAKAQKGYSTYEDLLVGDILWKEEVVTYLTQLVALGKKGLRMDFRTENYGRHTIHGQHDDGAIFVNPKYYLENPTGFFGFIIHELTHLFLGKATKEQWLIVNRIVARHPDFVAGLKASNALVTLELSNQDIQDLLELGVLPESYRNKTTDDIERERIQPESSGSSLEAGTQIAADLPVRSGAASATPTKKEETKPILYRGTTRDQWEAIQRGETPQSEFSRFGLTWVTTDLESAQAYSRRDGTERAVIIEYKPSTYDKVGTLTDYPGDTRRQGRLELKDIAKVYDDNGTVIYDADSAGNARRVAGQSEPLNSGARLVNVLPEEIVGRLRDVYGELNHNELSEIGQLVQDDFRVLGMAVASRSLKSAETYALEFEQGYALVASQNPNDITFYGKNEAGDRADKKGSVTLTEELVKQGREDVDKLRGRSLEAVLSAAKKELRTEPQYFVMDVYREQDRRTAQAFRQMVNRLTENKFAVFQFRISDEDQSIVQNIEQEMTEFKAEIDRLNEESMSKKEPGALFKARFELTDKDGNVIQTLETAQQMTELEATAAAQFHSSIENQSFLDQAVATQAGYLPTEGIHIGEEIRIFNYKAIGRTGLSVVTDSPSAPQMLEALTGADMSRADVAKANLQLVKTPHAIPGVSIQTYHNQNLLVRHLATIKQILYRAFVTLRAAGTSA